MGDSFIYYTIIIVISLLSMIICSFMVSWNTTLGQKTKLLCVLTFIAVCVAASLEWVNIALEYYSAGNKIIRSLIKLMELCIAPFLGFLVGSIFRKSILNKIIFFFCCGHALIEIALIFNGSIITFDESGAYQHGPFYWIYSACYFITALYSIFEMSLFAFKYRYRSGLILIVTVVLCVGGTAVRAAFSNVRIDWLAMSIGFIFMYISLVEAAAQTDVLTTLGNRRAFENYVARLKKDATLIVFDIDDFKQVNDTYGHVVGDMVLAKAGEAIKESFSSMGNCYRYGGDEFVCVLTRNLESIDEAISNFYSKLDEARKTESRVPYVSLGKSQYRVGGNVLIAIEDADANMYQNKREKDAKAQLN